MRMRSIRMGAFFFCMALVLFSCGEASGFTPEFDRETFDRERQLWLEQGIQNYSFHQYYQLSNISAIYTTLFVKNGIARYYRQDEFTDELYELKNDGFQYTFFGGLLLLPVSELYAEIERVANYDLYKITVRYASDLHYPIYVQLLDTNYRVYTISFIDNFIADPVMPGGSSPTKY